MANKIGRNKQLKPEPKTDETQRMLPGDPTPEEIAERAAAIRESWVVSERPRTMRKRRFER